MDVPSNANAYTKCLIKLMSFIDGVQYNTIAPSFSSDQLAAITTDQVASYLNKEAYGMPSPGPEDHLHLMRSSSLAFQKMSISQFMPLTACHGMTSIFKATPPAPVP